MQSAVFVGHGQNGGLNRELFRFRGAAESWAAYDYAACYISVNSADAGTRRGGERPKLVAL